MPETCLCVIEIDTNDVVYFDQLSGAACTPKLVDIIFWAVFNLSFSFLSFVSDFSSEINKKCLQKAWETVFYATRWKTLKINKMVENGQEKYLDQHSCACSTQKRVKIHNKWAVLQIDSSNLNIMNGRQASFRNYIDKTPFQFEWVVSTVVSGILFAPFSTVECVLTIQSFLLMSERNERENRLFPPLLVYVTLKNKSVFWFIIPW